MARGQSDLLVRPGEVALSAVGRIARRAGLWLTLLALPLAVVTGALVASSAPSIPAGLANVVAAVTGPLGAPAGVAWLLHVAVLGVLVGAWLLGAGMVLSALFE